MMTWPMPDCCMALARFVAVALGVIVLIAGVVGVATLVLFTMILLRLYRMVKFRRYWRRRHRLKGGEF